MILCVPSTVRIFSFQVADKNIWHYQHSKSKEQRNWRPTHLYSGSCMTWKTEQATNSWAKIPAGAHALLVSFPSGPAVIAQTQLLPLLLTSTLDLTLNLMSIPPYHKYRRPVAFARCSESRKPLESSENFLLQYLASADAHTDAKDWSVCANIHRYHMQEDRRTLNHVILRNKDINKMGEGRGQKQGKRTCAVWCLSGW